MMILRSCSQETKLKQEEHEEYEEMLKSQFPGDIPPPLDLMPADS